MSLPINKMPAYFDQSGKQRINRRAAKLIRQYGGRIVKYRDLPQEAQLALAQYMAVDGEAWEVAPGLDEAMRAYWPKRDVKSWESVLRKFLPFYIDQYGGFDFGYIDAVPVKALIESAMTDRELQQDWQGWQEYHRWYMREAGGPKHNAPGKKPWPVVLSSFDDETLEDGWTRFHQYAERGLKTCPAVWFPRQQSRKGAAHYRKLELA